MESLLVSVLCNFIVEQLYRKKLKFAITFTERFKREARVVARLEHPHIVLIYDIGESEGRPVIIMRLLSGGTLRDQTAKQGFDLAALMKSLEQIGDALASAHARQIIHRDIKPGNILFDENGSAFLSDFGIAKVLDSATQLTGSGFIGTPAYMSPEQFIGQTIDGRSDQYSLAIVVYEALTGDLPFKGNTAHWTCRLLPRLDHRQMQNRYTLLWNKKQRAQV